jgi:hypothetical protein
VNGVDWSLLSDALLRVEWLSHDESGMLSFGLEKTGGIFVEKSRICWVAARGRARRLRDLLSEHAHVSAPVLDDVFERCRNEGLPVGQRLVADGLLRPDELEHALRRHSAECLVELSRTPLPTRWAAHPGRGYAPRFTFRPAELWLEAVAVCYPSQRVSALTELSRLQGPTRRAAAFVLDGRDLALPIAMIGAHTVGALRMVAQFATTMPQVSLELGLPSTFTLASTEEGDAAVVWWKDGLLFAELCENRENLAAALAGHLTQA